MTAHQIAQRTIPQMRTSSAVGAGSLAVSTTVTDGIAVVSVRGSTSVPLDPFLTALDAVFETDVGGVILECTQVTDWSRRGIEIGVLTATRARGRRMGIAIVGLPADQLGTLRRQWQGIGSEWFTFTDLAAARAALGSPMSRGPGDDQFSGTPQIRRIPTRVRLICHCAHKLRYGAVRQ